MTGETEAAAWVMCVDPAQPRHADGRIDGPYRVFDEWCTYRDATLIVGAQLAAQYDLSFGLWPGLLFRVRDPRSGLFANDRLPRRNLVRRTGCHRGRPRRRGSRRWPSATSGRRGRSPRSSADSGTPARLPDRFFHVWSRRRQAIITAADPEFQAPTMLPRPDVDAPQYWFWGGICAAFLCRLYQAEPRPEYLELARRYQDFAMAATDAQFTWPAACKGSWGCVPAAGSSPASRNTGVAFRMGDWYVDRQEPDGRWHPLVEETLGDVIEVRLEFVMHLDTIISGLGSRAGAGH